jgi:hypothetical protein
MSVHHPNGVSEVLTVAPYAPQEIPERWHV